MVVFRKKGKPPLNPGSYRPIPLINMDAKVYAKILAKSLGKVIANLVSPCQHGLIPDQGTTDNVQRVITLFETAEATKRPMGLVLLDAKKAFDRVSWGYFWEVLRWKRLGPGFIKAIRVLHQTVKARFQIMRVE